MRKIHKLISVIVLIIFAYFYIGTFNEATQEREKPPEYTKSPTNMGEHIVEIIQPIATYPEYDIPLEDDLQEYIWNLANEYEISYEMVLAVINAESSFRTDVVSRTNDYGLMQINSKYMDYHAANAGIDNFDPFNPYQNVKVGIHLLATERNYWRSQEMGEEYVFMYTLGSYKCGRTGLKNSGLPWDYINKISNYKTQLELSNI